MCRHVGKSPLFALPKRNEATAAAYWLSTFCGVCLSRQPCRALATVSDRRWLAVEAYKRLAVVVQSPKSQTCNCTMITYARHASPFILIALAIVALAGVAPQSFAKVFGNQSEESHSNPGTDSELRMREGTTVEELRGHFKLTGDRVTFFAVDGKQRFGGLENLALERVARAVKDSPGQLRWQVTGIVTEYRGANYLLVTRAMMIDSNGAYESR